MRNSIFSFLQCGGLYCACCGIGGGVGGAEYGMGTIGVTVCVGYDCGA